MSQQKSRDTIDVRTGEEIDVDRLRTYLTPHLEALGVSDGELELRQFGGGMANLTYELIFPRADRRFVLRRPPFGPVAASAHDMGREYKVLSTLYRVFPLAPRAFVYCDDIEVIGAPFFIMERRHGIVVRRQMPPSFQNDPTAAGRMSEALVDALADFHAVDFKAIGLEDLGRPEGFITRQIEGWFKRWQKARLEDDPAERDMESAYRWLLDNEPATQNQSLIHNDYKLDNVMLDPQDPGRMVAIFDWDMCTLGDPLSDLGALLTYWTDEDDPPYMKLLSTSFMPVGVSGFLARRELANRYARRSGRDIGQINFYRVLGMYRLTVIIAQIYIRFVRGQTQDERFASLGELIPLMARAAVELINSRI